MRVRGGERVRLRLSFSFTPHHTASFNPLYYLSFSSNFVYHDFLKSTA